MKRVLRDRGLRSMTNIRFSTSNTDVERDTYIPVCLASSFKLRLLLVLWAFIRGISGYHILKIFRVGFYKR